MRAPRPQLFPDVRDNSVETIRTLRKAAIAALESKHTATSPLEELLLVSPSGFVYAVRVGDDGALTTELRSTP